MIEGKDNSSTIVKGPNSTAMAVNLQNSTDTVVEQNNGIINNQQVRFGQGLSLPGMLFSRIFTVGLGQNGVGGNGVVIGGNQYHQFGRNNYNPPIGNNGIGVVNANLNENQNNNDNANPGNVGGNQINNNGEGNGMMSDELAQQLRDQQNNR